MTFRQLRWDDHATVATPAAAQERDPEQAADVAVRTVYAPLAIWSIAAALAHALAAPAPVAGPILAIVAAGLAIAFLRHDVAALALTLAALIPVAAATVTPEWTWVVSGALVACAVGRSRRVVSISLNDLERHLSWCRRRGEAADVAYIAFDASAVADPVELIESFRVTDSVLLNRRRGGVEVLAILDHHTFDRSGLERRIAATAGTSGRWGWARFPDDGFTLDVLLERACAAAPAPATHELRHSPATPQPATARGAGKREQAA